MLAYCTYVAWTGDGTGLKERKTKKQKQNSKPEVSKVGDRMLVCVAANRDFAGQQPANF